MALIIRKPGQDLPKGAVKMTEEQALRYQLNIIDNWPNYSEVFAFRSSTGILGGMAAISSFLINNHFRYKLKLGNYGRASSYLTVVITPVLFTTLFHKTFIQSRVMLRAYECPICLETNSALLQGGMGVLYPFLLAPTAAFMFATRHFTYRLPSITTQTKDVVKLWWKFTKSAKTLASVLLAVNMFVAMAIAAREIEEHAIVNRNLEEYEKRFESGSLEESDM